LDNSILFDWAITVGLQNIWDEAPPNAGVGLFRVGTAALNGYDMRGRRASLRVTKTF
jgi:iron complex outermembrane receptor protein